MQKVIMETKIKQIEEDKAYCITSLVPPAPLLQPLKMLKSMENVNLSHELIRRKLNHKSKRTCM